MASFLLCLDHSRGDEPACKRQFNAVSTGNNMKKFSTAALLLALSTGFGFSGMAHAQAAKTMRCEFLANAPDQHVVVRGDTLWGISGKFLQHPWCWPQVWGLNQDQIRNPHWI